MRWCRFVCGLPRLSAPCSCEISAISCRTLLAVVFGNGSLSVTCTCLSVGTIRCLSSFPLVQIAQLSHSTRSFTVTEVVQCELSHICRYQALIEDKRAVSWDSLTESCTCRCCCYLGRPPTTGDPLPAQTPPRNIG